MVCPSCQRPVSEPDALFCAGCGAPLPPTTVDLDAPPPPRTPPPPAPAVAEAPALPAEAPPPPPPVPDSRTDNRPAAYVALLGAALGIIGAFQVWLRITIATVSPPGSAETGWRGGDGRTIVVAAVVAAIAGIGLLLGRRDLWLKVALLIAGGVILVIALVHMANVPSKAEDIERQFGIPMGDVRAEVGTGLYVAIAGGVAILTAGLRARTTSS